MNKVRTIDIETKGGQKFVREIAKQAAREAVHETLLSFGWDSRNPQEAQADLVYLKRLRKHMEFTHGRLIATVIALSVSAIVFVAWEGVKNTLQR